jgi:hypothetical protein
MWCSSVKVHYTRVGMWCSSVKVHYTRVGMWCSSVKVHYTRVGMWCSSVEVHPHTCWDVVLECGSAPTHVLGCGARVWKCITHVLGCGARVWKCMWCSSVEVQYTRVGMWCSSVEVHVVLECESAHTCWDVVLECGSAVNETVQRVLV